MRASNWQSIQDVLQAFPNAKGIDAERVRFAVHGGDYRMIVAFFFEDQTAYIEFIGTHADYDAIDATKVSLFQRDTMKLRPIRNDDDLQDALRQVDELWRAAPGSPEAGQLELLTILIERYEDEKWPIDESDPIDILTYAFTEMGHSQAELATLLGSRSRASEIMGRKRPLTLDMIRKISEAWHIPIAVLAKPYALAKANNPEMEAIPLPHAPSMP